MFLVPTTRSSAELARLFDDGLFDRFFSPTRADDSSTPGSRSPALDVAETDRGYTVTLDMPGVRKEDVKIAIDGRRISVEATTTSHKEKKDGERVVYTERSRSSFSRSFMLPTEVEQAESSARMADGVLTLQLAKRTASKTAQLTVS